MAYDKVVDSSVLNTGLTQIANAIREKSGTYDNLAFPTAMAEAIAAIATGGGASYHEIVTFASDTKKYTVSHSLGEKPNYCFCIPMFESSSVGMYKNLACIAMIVSGKQYNITLGTGGSASSGKGFCTVTYYEFADKTYEYIDGDAMDGKSLIHPQDITENSLILEGSSYNFPSGTYFIWCGVADFGGV